MTRPDLCAEHGHPLVTFNLWVGRTWCLCGEAQAEGDQVRGHVACCCGGALVECLHD